MGKAIDLTGQRFGRLVVVCRAEKLYGKQSAWLCKCDCGNEKVVAAQSLRSGATTSCGCYHKEVISGVIHDHEMIGKRYNRLVVLERVMIDTKGSKSRYKYWRCRCDCGNETIVITKYLKSGKIKSCGCYKRENTSAICSAKLEGQRFGHLLVLERKERTDDKNKGHVCWKCRCDCGTITYPTTGGLLSGRTLSCGCSNSRGEQIIKKVLDDQKLSYQRQKKFPGMKDVADLS